MFDSIIESAKTKLGIGGDSAGAILAALLKYLVDPKNGGFSAFLDRFRSAGLGSVVDSWIGRGASDPLTSDQVKAALGAGAVRAIASDAGVGEQEASAAMAAMIPQVVDDLTPDGSVPSDENLLSRIGGWLSDWGGAIGGAVAGGVGAASAAAGGAANRVGDAGSAAYAKGRDALRDVGGSVSDGAGGSGSVLRWLIPLLLLGLVIALGYMFCGRSTTPTGVNVNANANVNRNASANTAKAVDASFSIKADNGKYTVTGVVPDEATKKRIVDALTAQYGAGNVNFDGLRVDANAKPFAAGWWDNFAKMLPNLKDWKTGTLSFAGNAITEATGLPAAALDQLRSLFSGWTLPASLGAAEADANRSLSEVSLPNGTKLQAYPGGIEDQLVKFIGSSEYKDGTADSLKDKWFSFDDLNFKFGTTELEASSKRQLDNIAAILKAFPDAKIKIGGYTDKKGDDAANLKLSDGRAKAVQAALQKAGVGAQVPEAEGYGETFATVEESASDDARRVDRKTAVRLLK